MSPDLAEVIWVVYIGLLAVVWAVGCTGRRDNIPEYMESRNAINILVITAVAVIATWGYLMCVVEDMPWYIFALHYAWLGVVPWVAMQTYSDPSQFVYGDIGFDIFMLVILLVLGYILLPTFLIICLFKYVEEKIKSDRSINTPVCD